MKNFWVRTASAAVYAVLFLGSIYSGALLDNPLWGNIILTAFALFVTIGCTFEFYRLIDKQGASPSRAVGYVVAVAILFSSLLFSSPVCPMEYMPLELSAVLWRVLPAVVILSAPLTIALQLWGHSKQPFADAAYTLLPALYVASAMGLMNVLHYEYNILVMCIIMVWTNDCGAYMGGSVFGKHKMWPRHSPGKTWEGTAIGVVAAVLVGVFVGPLFQTMMLWYDWVALALLCGVVGTLGDLAESMLKRSVGTKDSGNIMPGHGGFLDRFDSLLFILPVVCAYCILFKP